MDEKKKGFILPKRGRSPEHIAMMEKIKKSGKCPFCSDSFLEGTNQEVLFENYSWRVINNIKPYENTKVHLVLIPREHAESFQELSIQSGADLFSILREIEKRYAINSGAFFMRFGDPLYNGGSVHHIHAQIIVPDIGPNKDWDKLKVKLGENPK